MAKVRVDDALQKLVDIFGPSVVAAMLGTGGAPRIKAWIDGTDQPEERHLERLRFTYELVLELEKGLGQAGVRRWFLTLDLRVGNLILTPQQAINKGHFAEVRKHAKPLISIMQEH